MFSVHICLVIDDVEIHELYTAVCTATARTRVQLSIYLCKKEIAVFQNVNENIYYLWLEGKIIKYFLISKSLHNKSLTISRVKI